MIVIPTIFAKNRKNFNARLKKLIPISKNIQIDFMDGKFVDARSVRIKDIPNLNNYDSNFEAHLMCMNPEKCTEELKKKGFKRVLFHYEAYNDSERVKFLAHYLRVHHLIPGVVFNPKTNFDKIKEIAHFVHLIVFMGHNPGKEHLNLNTEVLQKIRKLRKWNKKLTIQVDGGVNEKTIRRLEDAGVDVVNVGSFISEAENAKEALKVLKSAL